jgi:hypothetical protein
MVPALLPAAGYQSTRVLRQLITFVVVGIGSLVLAILDHFTDSPMMRKRANNASDRFLEDHDTILRSAAISMRAALGYRNNSAGSD